MLLTLTRQGVGRFPQETPRELASRLSTQGYPKADAVERLTAAFERERYAERAATEARIEALEADLHAVKRVSKRAL